MRFLHLAHRSAAAHKLHSTPQQDRMNLISGKGETSSRLPGPFSLFLPGSCPNNRNRCIYGLLGDLASVPAMMMLIAAVVLVTLPLAWRLGPHLHSIPRSGC